MTEQHQPPNGEPSTRKPSMWQRFKRWPLIARIATIASIGILAIVVGALNAGSAEQDRQDAAEQESREEGEANATESEPPEPSPDPSTTPADNQGAAEESAPEGIDAQVAGMTGLPAFEDAEVFYSEATGDYPYDIIFVDQEIEMDLFVSTVCTKAREQTVEALEFARDYIPGDYDRLSLSFTTRGEPDATGDSPIIGIATVVYERDTVQSIDSDAVNTGNVWEARDEGTPSSECQ